MKLFSLFFLALVSQIVLAQEKESPWENGMVANLNASQSSYSNWTAGGEETFTWQAQWKGTSDYTHNKFSFNNKAKFGYGRTQIGDANSRKSLDELALESKVDYKVFAKFGPYSSIRFESQFTTGFLYTDTTARKSISSFMDPGYLTESMGMGYTPNKVLNTRLGFAVKQTFADKYAWADDPETEKFETFRNEPGLESISQLKWKFSEILSIESSLTLFANFEGLEKVDGRWETSLAAQVSKYFQFTAGYDVLYDWDLSLDTQYKRGITAGFVYQL